MHLFLFFLLSLMLFPFYIYLLGLQLFATLSMASSIYLDRKTPSSLLQLLLLLQLVRSLPRRAPPLLPQKKRSGASSERKERTREKKGGGGGALAVDEKKKKTEQGEKTEREKRARETSRSASTSSEKSSSPSSSSDSSTAAVKVSHVENCLSFSSQGFFVSSPLVALPLLTLQHDSLTDLMPLYIDIYVYIHGYVWACSCGHSCRETNHVVG